MAYNYNYDVTSNQAPGWKTTRDADARALLGGTQSLYNQFGDIANNGIFGAGGADNLARMGRAAGMFDINQAVRYGAPGFAGRVGGADSGAYRAALINRSFAPFLADNMRQRVALNRENELSKVGGMQGLMQLLEFMQQRKEKGKTGYAGKGSGGFDKVIGALATLAQGASLL